MGIQNTNWTKGLFVSVVFMLGAIGMEKDIGTTIENQPTTTTNMPSNDKVDTIIEDIEEKGQRCCSAFIKISTAANNLMSQAMVTSILLSSNIQMYDDLLNKGLNKNNIDKFKNELQELLKVTQLNSQTIAMIQQVIAAHPTPSTLTGTDSPQMGTQMHVTRSMLKSNIGDVDNLLKQGMTAKNFTKSKFLPQILKAADVEDNKEHRNLVKTVLKTYTMHGLFHKTN